MQRRPSTPRATLADVARLAGVSPKTVSRVVNGEPHVSDGVASRVAAAIAELHYRPDRRASELARGPSSSLVGFVLVDAGNPFFASVSRGLDDRVRAEGHLVISASTDADAAREAALVDTFAELRVRGMVVASAEGDDDQLRREIAHGTPVVCIDRVLDPDVDCDTVVSDNLEATRSAVGLLLDRGHRRIGFLGGSHNVWTARERHLGYHHAHEDHNVVVDDDLVVQDIPDAAAAAAACEGLLRQAGPPTAVFAAQDQLTIGAVRALRRLACHHHVALIGFDDVPQAQDLDPAVAVISQDPHQMGWRAGEHLLDRLSGRHEQGPRTTVVPTQFIERASALITPP